MPEPTTATAVERYDEPRGAVALSERDMKSITFQAKAIAYLDPRFKDMDTEEREQTSLALAITLHNYGLPITVTNGKKFHLIQGEPVESAQLLIGLLEMAGHEVRPMELNDQRCVLRGWRHGRGQPYEMTYTLEQARTSGALDEWVEKWRKDGNKWKLDERRVIRRDGVEINTPWPDWALKQIGDNRVKRKDAWFNYRSDMLANRCIRRLSKWMGADALLGAGGRYEDDEDEGERYNPPLRVTVEEDDDDDITDADIVDEPAFDTSTVADRAETGSDAPTASQQWVSDFLAACQDLELDGVRPGALAAAIVRHVTDSERSEPATLRRGAEQTAAKTTFTEVADGRWDVGTGQDGMAVLVEATPHDVDAESS